MSAPHTYVIDFSNMQRWQTTVSATHHGEALDEAARLWAEQGADGDHPFDLLDDRVFDQPDWRIEDEPPPEQTWSVRFLRTAAFTGEVRASTEREAIGIAQAMVHDTDVAFFQRTAMHDGDWRAEMQPDRGSEDAAPPQRQSSLRDALQTLIASCEEALDGRWDRGDDGFADMIEVARAALLQDGGASCR